MCLGARVKFSVILCLFLLLGAGQVFAAGFLVKSGMRGENVRQVQQLLTDVGYSLGNVDGICGEATVKAIKKFQADNGLAVDGVVGDDTYSYLTRNMPKTSRHNGHKAMREIYMNASGYSAFDPGNSACTATGATLKKGIVAVDPSVIPLGTRVYIPGYGEAVAADVGTGIRGDMIDLAFDTHEEALLFGRQSISVYVIEE